MVLVEMATEEVKGAIDDFIHQVRLNPEYPLMLNHCSWILKLRHSLLLALNTVYPGDEQPEESTLSSVLQCPPDFWKSTPGRAARLGGGEATTERG